MGSRFKPHLKYTRAMLHLTKNKDKTISFPDLDEIDLKEARNHNYDDPLLLRKNGRWYFAFNIEGHLYVMMITAWQGFFESSKNVPVQKLVKKQVKIRTVI